MVTTEPSDSVTIELEGLAEVGHPGATRHHREERPVGEAKMPQAPSPPKQKRRRQRRRAGTLTADEGQENRWQTAAGSWGAWRRRHHNSKDACCCNQKCRREYVACGESNRGKMKSMRFAPADGGAREGAARHREGSSSTSPRHPPCLSPFCRQHVRRSTGGRRRTAWESRRRLLMSMPTSPRPTLLFLTPSAPLEARRKMESPQRPWQENWIARCTTYQVFVHTGGLLILPPQCLAGEAMASTAMGMRSLLFMACLCRLSSVVLLLDVFPGLPRLLSWIQGLADFKPDESPSQEEMRSGKLSLYLGGRFFVTCPFPGGSTEGGKRRSCATDLREVLPAVIESTGR